MSAPPPPSPARAAPPPPMNRIPSSPNVAPPTPTSAPPLPLNTPGGSSLSQMTKAPPPPLSKSAPTPSPPTPRPPPPTPKTSPPPTPVVIITAAEPSLEQKGHCSTAGCLRVSQAGGRCEDHTRGPPFSTGFWIEQSDSEGTKYYSSLTTGLTSRSPPPGFRAISPARTVDSAPEKSWQTKANRQSMRQYECWKAVEISEPGARIGKKCVIVGDALRGLRQEGWSSKSLLLHAYNSNNTDSNSSSSGFNDAKDSPHGSIAKDSPRESVAPHENIVRVDGISVTLQLWDTSGQEQDEKLRQLAYFQAGVFILVFSILSKESYHNAKYLWAAELRQLAPGVPIVLVGVDADMRKQQSADDSLVSEHDGWKRAFEIQDCLEYLECDLSSPSSVAAVFEQAARVTLGKISVESVPPSFHFFPSCSSSSSSSSSSSRVLSIPGQFSSFVEDVGDFKYSTFLGDRLFAASGDTISIVSADKTVSKLATWFQDISGIAFREKDLFVTCHTSGVISRVCLSGKVVQFAHPPLVRGLSGLAVLGEDVFVGCWIGGLIVRVSPTCLTCLAQGPFHGPLSLAIYADMLYVANELEGVIHKVPLDGSGAFTTFAKGLSGPTSLAFLGESLFVANKYSGVISRISLDGTVVEFASGLRAPCGLSFAGDDLYIVDENTIYKVSIPVWASALDMQDAVQICALISTNNSLCLRQCVDNAGAALLAQCLEGNTHLRVLDLDNNSFDDEGAIALAKLLESHPLLSLSLSGNQIGDLGAMAFGKLLNMNNTLASITLSANKIGLAGAMSMIEGIMRSRVISKVELSDNPLPKSWIALVGALAQMQEVTEISLTSSSLTSAQLFLLAEKLKTNTTLRFLRLENNNITEETAAAFWNALNWQLAVRLGLMEEDNTDILKPINKVPCLTTITVTGRALYTPRLPPPSKGVSVLSIWLEGFSQQVKYYYWGHGDDESRSDEDSGSSSDEDSGSDSEMETKWPRSSFRRALDSDSDPETHVPLPIPRHNSGDSDSDSDEDASGVVQFNRRIAPKPTFVLKKLNKPPPYLVLETGEFAEDLFKTVVSTHPKVFARDGPRNHKRLSYYESCDMTLRSVINSVQLFCGRFLFQSTFPEYKSARSVVLRATDSSLGLTASEVVLKLIRDEDQFRREVEVRNELGGQYVSEVMCSSEMFRDWSSTVDRFCGVNYKWGIVLEAAQRNLQTILVHERLSMGTSRDFFHAATKCVRSVHQAGRIHCDIKPLHLLRMSDHTWRLAGFSSCMERNHALSAMTLKSSSTAYMPPEVFVEQQHPEGIKGRIVVGSGVKANYSFDLWSLGCILFWALARKSLFEADDEDNLRNASEHKRLNQWNTRSLSHALIEAGESMRTTIQHNFDDVGDIPTPAFRRLAGLDLLGWLLQRDSAWRPPSCDIVLEHAFFKGESGVLFMSNLHLAAGLGNVRQVERELLASTQHPLGKTPLHIAAEEGQLAAVNALLSAGASPEVTDGTGYTPLQSVLYLLNNTSSELGRKLVLVCERLREVTKSRTE